MGLLRAEHPPIGTVRLFGHTFWAGWLMIAAMVYTGIGPFILGRLKLPLAEQLHDKVLYADADMQKADWMTAAGTIVGVLGIGMGLWWADAGGRAADLAARSCVTGGRNLQYATAALMDDARPDLRRREPHPLTRRGRRGAGPPPWVAEAAAAVRDQGHVFHVESFVRPRDGEDATLDQLEEAVDVLRDLDWKVHDVVVMPVRDLPETIPDPHADPDQPPRLAVGADQLGGQRRLGRQLDAGTAHEVERVCRALDRGDRRVEGRDDVAARVHEADAGERRRGQVAAQRQLDGPVRGVGAYAVGGGGLLQGGEVEGVGAELVLDRGPPVGERLVLGRLRLRSGDGAGRVGLSPARGERRDEQDGQDDGVDEWAEGESAHDRQARSGAREPVRAIVTDQYVMLDSLGCRVVRTRAAMSPADGAEEVPLPRDARLTG